MLGIGRRFVLTVLIATIAQFTGVATVPASDADATITVNPGQIVRSVPPGVVGWGAMWKRAFLQPPPPADFTDASHAAYIQEVGAALAPLVRASDTRHLS